MKRVSESVENSVHRYTQCVHTKYIKYWNEYLREKPKGQTLWMGMLPVPWFFSPRKLIGTNISWLTFEYRHKTHHTCMHKLKSLLIVLYRCDRHSRTVHHHNVAQKSATGSADWKIWWLNSVRSCFSLFFLCQEKDGSRKHRTLWVSKTFRASLKSSSITTIEWILSCFVLIPLCITQMKTHFPLCSQSVWILQSVVCSQMKRGS